MEDFELTVRKAEEMLTEYAVTVADRDNVIRLAYASGVTKSRIHRLSGVARDTIDRILGTRNGPPPG